MIGMIAGALASAGTEAMAAREEEKARKRSETIAEFGYVPKRKRLARVGKAASQAISNKQRALIALAQAHQNFASMW
jgi:hypothetical protein